MSFSRPNKWCTCPCEGTSTQFYGEHVFLGMQLSRTEQNYLKAIYMIGALSSETIGASTNSIAMRIETRPASVSDMVRRLSEKGLVNHNRYRGVTLTECGLQQALVIVRRHRLWEHFLVHVLGFRWDEIHEIAEELEHVSHPELIARLDAFLGNPTEDPHGELIPGAQLQMPHRPTESMHSLPPGAQARVVCVDEGSDGLLKYLDEIELRPGAIFTVVSVEHFDQSMRIRRVDESVWRITREVSNSVQVERMGS